LAVPTCRRCLRQHYNFVSCTKAAEQPFPSAEPPLQLRVPEGFRLWGDRLETWERQGNVYYRKAGHDTPQEAA